MLKGELRNITSLHEAQIFLNWSHFPRKLILVSEKSLQILIKFLLLNIKMRWCIKNVKRRIGRLPGNVFLYNSSLKHSPVIQPETEVKSRSLFYSFNGWIIILFIVLKSNQNKYQRVHLHFFLLKLHQQ